MEDKENEIAANIAYKMLQLFYIGIAIIFFQYFIIFYKQDQILNALFNLVFAFIHIIKFFIYKKNGNTGQ